MAERAVGELEHEIASIRRLDVKFAENILDKALIFSNLFWFHTVAYEGFGHCGLRCGISVTFPTFLLGQRIPPAVKKFPSRCVLLFVRAHALRRPRHRYAQSLLL